MKNAIGEENYLNFIASAKIKKLAMKRKRERERKSVKRPKKLCLFSDLETEFCLRQRVSLCVLLLFLFIVYWGTETPLTD